MFQHDFTGIWHPNLLCTPELITLCANSKSCKNASSFTFLTKALKYCWFTTSLGISRIVSANSGTKSLTGVQFQFCAWELSCSSCNTLCAKELWVFSIALLKGIQDYFLSAIFCYDLFASMLHKNVTLVCSVRLLLPSEEFLLNILCFFGIACRTSQIWSRFSFCPILSFLGGLSSLSVKNLCPLVHPGQWQKNQLARMKNHWSRFFN